MSIDISSKNYCFDVGNSNEIDYLLEQGKNYPTFCKLLTYGKLLPSESPIVLDEIEDIEFGFTTSSGKSFQDELKKVLADSINSNSDIIAHGVFSEVVPFDPRIQKFWGTPITNQEITIRATPPENISQTKWRLINMDLTDFHNKKIKYSPLVENGHLVALRCGVCSKDISKGSASNELKGLINKLKTFKFVVVIEKNQNEIDRTNFKVKIMEANNI